MLFAYCIVSSTIFLLGTPSFIRFFLSPSAILRHVINVCGEQKCSARVNTQQGNISSATVVVVR